MPSSSQAIPLHSPPLAMAHFVELADALRSPSARPPTQETLAVLQGAHTDLFLGLPSVRVWATGPEEVWACLCVPVEKGDQWVDAEGDTFQNLEQADAKARRRLGGWPCTVVEGSGWEVLADVGVTPPKQPLRSTHHQAGIGLHFRCDMATQTLDEDAIVEELWGFSCHPFIGRAIVQDLRIHGERSVTVMPNLAPSLPTLRNLLAPLGVEVRRTWAMPSRGHRDVPADQQAVAAPLFMNGVRTRPMR